MTANLLDHLQEQGYEPQDSGDEWFDLIASGIGSVRVVLSDDIYVYAFDGYMASEWEARFTPGTPDAVILATLEAAEWQLADKRGGPVTPAQAESAR